jgi:histidinol-phosphate/aromatic aminotransferase/cobyric acid decarboxylase-like protein
MIAETIREREKLVEKLSGFHLFKRIYPSDANFVPGKTTNADAIYKLSYK